MGERVCAGVGCVVGERVGEGEGERVCAGVGCVVGERVGDTVGEGVDEAAVGAE